LQRAECNQLTRRLRQPAQERREREDDQPGEEHSPSAIAVTRDAAGQQQRREREDVAVDYPLQAAHARAQFVTDRRERHIHDGVVEHRHEQREAARQ
jgi:hypothetical protein